MKKELKRRIYALALSGIILAAPKMKAYAEESNTTIDIEKAISELVPNYTETNDNCYHLYEENPNKIINFINPTCTENGSYEEIYYCVKCGETKTISKTIEALGHNWSDPIIENHDENGYDIVNKCQNNGCLAEVIQHVNYSTPTESINQNQNNNDNNTEYSNSNKNLELALTSLGIAGASIYAANKIKKSNNIKIKINKPYKGKYLEKKK